MAFILKRATNNSPYEIFRFPNLKWVDNKKVDLTEDQKQQIEKAALDGVEIQLKKKMEGIRIYDTHISSYESTYINDLLRSPAGTITSWIRIRKSETVEESDTIFMYRAKDQLWHGLIDENIIYFSKFVYGMKPEEWKFAVAVSKTDYKDIDKLARHFDEALYGSQKEKQYNYRMAWNYIRDIMFTVKDSEIWRELEEIARTNC